MAKLTSIKSVNVNDLLTQDKAAMVYVENMFWLIADLNELTRYCFDVILVNGDKTLHTQLQLDNAVFIITPQECAEYNIIAE